MTYEESYMKCETLEELRKAIEKDVNVAMTFNTDRLIPINKAGIKVAELKFGDQIK